MMCYGLANTKQLMMILVVAAAQEATLLLGFGFQYILENFKVSRPASPIDLLGEQIDQLLSILLHSTKINRLPILRLRNRTITRQSI